MDPDAITRDGNRAIPGQEHSGLCVRLAPYVSEDHRFCLFSGWEPEEVHPVEEALGYHPIWAEALRLHAATIVLAAGQDLSFDLLSNPGAWRNTGAVQSPLLRYSQIPTVDAVSAEARALVSDAWPALI